jgi:hypothetical protein
VDIADDVLSAMRAHRGTGSSNPFPSRSESRTNLSFAAAPGVRRGRGASRSVVRSFESRPIVRALRRCENTCDQHRQGCRLRRADPMNRSSNRTVPALSRRGGSQRRSPVGNGRAFRLKIGYNRFCANRSRLVSLTSPTVVGSVSARRPGRCGAWPNLHPTSVYLSLAQLGRRDLIRHEILRREICRVYTPFCPCIRSVGGRRLPLR